MLTTWPSSMTSLPPHLRSLLNPDSTWYSGLLVIRYQPYPGLSWIIPIGIKVFNLVKCKGNNCGKPDRYFLLTASLVLFPGPCGLNLCTHCPPLVFLYPGRGSHKGCPCHVVSGRKEKRTEHPDSSILFTAFSPLRRRGRGHHPKWEDHLFFFCENFKGGVIWKGRGSCVSLL